MDREKRIAYLPGSLFGCSWGTVLPDLSGCDVSLLAAGFSLPSTDPERFLWAATICNSSEVTMNKIASVVVSLESSEAAPRGPKVDWLP
jgi:hypothetical protein